MPPADAVPAVAVPVATAAVVEEADVEAAAIDHDAAHRQLRVRQQVLLIEDATGFEVRPFREPVAVISCLHGLTMFVAKEDTWRPMI